MKPGSTSPIEAASFRRRLLRWYDLSRRALPWRETSDPWRILVSEIMLQQTRVETVVPYYHRFLARFPDAASLAGAAEPDVLAGWSGLGYYSRVRNLQRAAQVTQRAFPATYESIRDLPGVGPYTAAAVASIAFALPHAAVDGNVLRVIARVTCDAADISAARTKVRFTHTAQELLDPRRPGDFNQSMMELGATICVPRNPKCLLCPVAPNCLGRQQGRQRELPVKRSKAAPTAAALDVVIIQRGAAVLLKQRASTERRMAGFWELPAPADLALLALPQIAASFRHTIVNTAYTVQVLTGAITRRPARMRWFTAEEIAGIPLSTISKKALALCPREQGSNSAAAHGQ